MSNFSLFSCCWGKENKMFENFETKNHWCVLFRCLHLDILVRKLISHLSSVSTYSYTLTKKAIKKYHCKKTNLNVFYKKVIFQLFLSSLYVRPIFLFVSICLSRDIFSIISNYTIPYFEFALSLKNNASVTCSTRLIQNSFKK